MFRVTAPNRIWVGDMTFIRTRAGFLHLSVLLDLFSRRVVGWAMGDSATTELAMHTLAMALLQRLPQPGLIHHSDQGKPYSARVYRECLRRHAILPSMNAVSNPTDNAVAESFFALFKNELIRQREFTSLEELRTAIFEYIEIFYNRQRRHSTLGFVSPMEFENNRREMQ